MSGEVSEYWPSSRGQDDGGRIRGCEIGHPGGARRRIDRAWAPLADRTSCATLSLTDDGRNTPHSVVTDRDSRLDRRLPGDGWTQTAGSVHPAIVEASRPLDPKGPSDSTGRCNIQAG